MYKMSCLFLTFSFFNFGQFSLRTKQGSKLNISRRVLGDCKTLNNLSKVPRSDDPITLGCSVHVPSSFLKNIFRGKSIKNLTLYRLCCLLHVGFYVENNKWIHYAQSHLLALVSAKSFAGQSAAYEITSSFEKLQDTQSLTMFSEHYIKNNPNKFYQCIVRPHNFEINSRWSYVGIQATNTSSCYLWLDKKNQNLFAVDSTTTTNIWIPLFCSKVYPTEIDNIIIAQHGSKLYSYDISTQQKKLLCSSYLDDINIYKNILTGWKDSTLFYWNLISGEHYILPFDISSTGVRSCIYSDAAQCAFVLSNNLGISIENKVIILNQKGREEIPLLSEGILQCLSTPDGNYSAIEYDDGIVQVVDIKSKKTTAVHISNRTLSHFSVSSDGFYWLLVYESYNNNPPMSILYIPSTQTKKYIPMGTIDSVLIAQFNKQDDIQLLVKKKNIYQQSLIKVNDLMSLSAIPLEKLVKMKK